MNHDHLWPEKYVVRARGENWENLFHSKLLWIMCDSLMCSKENYGFQPAQISYCYINNHQFRSWCGWCDQFIGMFHHHSMASFVHSCHFTNVIVRLCLSWDWPCHLKVSRDSKMITLILLLFWWFEMFKSLRPTR